MALFAFISLPMFFLKRGFEQFINERTLIIVMVVLVYLVGMMRTGGIDVENYLYAFNEDVTFIPDVGFQLIIILFNALGLPFAAMMLFISFINIYALRKIASFYHVSFGLLLILWFFHIVVVRDFAQMRSGLAVSLALLGVVTSKPWLKILLFTFSASVHITSIVFIFAFEFVKQVSQKKSKWLRFFLISVSIVLLIAIGQVLLPILSVFDERIEIYMAWNDSGYGAPVESYGILALHGLILMLAALTYQSWKSDVIIRYLIYLEIFSIATFIAFSNFAVFAFRLSNVVASLYPVLVILLISRVNLSYGKFNISPVSSYMFISFFLLVLTLRPGSFGILNSITF
tara:strand:- start:8717 stop:9748 length:1032 start_codon:yes stop_codon:yes gene_type:complete